jgi:plastocyanin
MNTKLIGIAVILLIVGVAVMFAIKRGNAPPAATSVEENVTEAPSVTAALQEPAVMITAKGFEPQTLTVKSNTTVTWTNKSGGVANVSSANHPTHLLYPPLNLGNVEDGKTVSLSFDTPGTYTYHNHLNPTQFGKIIVE